MAFQILLQELSKGNSHGVDPSSPRDDRLKYTSKNLPRLFWKFRMTLMVGYLSSRSQRRISIRYGDLIHSSFVTFVMTSYDPKDYSLPQRERCPTGQRGLATKKSRTGRDFLGYCVWSINAHLQACSRFS